MIESARLDNIIKKMDDLAAKHFTAISDYKSNIKPYSDAILQDSTLSYDKAATLYSMLSVFEDKYKMPYVYNWRKDPKRFQYESNNYLLARGLASQARIAMLLEEAQRAPKLIQKELIEEAFSYIDLYDDDTNSAYALLADVGLTDKKTLKQLAEYDKKYKMDRFLVEAILVYIEWAPDY